MRINIPRALLRTAQLMVRRRVHFPRGQVGQYVTLADRRRYRIFRAVFVDAEGSQPLEPGAVFVPHFHVRNMPPRLNIWFSWLPMLIILGLPGFRSKLWLIHEPTGDFAGLYEWDTAKDAKRYQDSIAMTFMTRRSYPESVSSEVIPGCTAAAALAIWRTQTEAVAGYA